MTEVYDIAIVGAGPAGMAAAGTATAAGARVVVVDSSPRVGGQFWRHAAQDSSTLSTLHAERSAYRSLKTAFDAAVRSGALTHLPSTSVWMAQPPSGGGDFSLHLKSEGGRFEPPPRVRARAVVVATGAYDRQLPVPGWNLPGVMAAGGIQGFIKQNGFAPGKRFLIAGTGPFLLPVALNVTQAGSQVAAICESSSLVGWAPHAYKALGVPSKLFEGARYSAALAARRIPYRTRTVVTEILGDGRVEAARTARVNADGTLIPGTERLIPGIDGVGLGWGFTPQVDIAVGLGAPTTLGADGSIVVAADPDGATGVAGLYVAGELTGVAGASLAVLEGARAGAAAAAATGGGAPLAPGWKRRRAANHARFAAAMHTVHRVPPAWRTWVPDPCLVCRCEEVSAGEIRAAREDLGATDQRSAKGVTRAGMGWCQGRVCGYAVAALAEGSEPSLDSLRRVSHRPITRPVPLELFTRLPEDSAE